MDSQNYNTSNQLDGQVFIMFFFVAIFACAIVLIVQSIKGFKNNYLKSSLKLTCGLLIIILYMYFFHFMLMNTHTISNQD